MRSILSGSSKGMVLDFSDLKKIVEDLLIDKLDHAFMINTNAEGLEHHLYLILRDSVKLYEVDYRPTAENMARDFYHIIKDKLMALDNTIKLESVKVWETVTAFAEYRR